MTDPIPPDSKLTTAKQRWAEQGRFLTSPVERPAAARLPPGPHLVRDWPVLARGVPPRIDPARWTLRVFGAVRQATTWDWAAFQGLPQHREVTDIHCVTTWSRYDNAWDGVSAGTVLDAVQPLPDASHVVLHSHDGYTTNLPLADFAVQNAILAHSWNGAPLTGEHGGPVRLIVPHLYLWAATGAVIGFEPGRPVHHRASRTSTSGSRTVAGRPRKRRRSFGGGPPMSSTRLRDGPWSIG